MVICNNMFHMRFLLLSFMIPDFLSVFNWELCILSDTNLTSPNITWLNQLCKSEIRHITGSDSINFSTRKQQHLTGTNLKLKANRPKRVSIFDFENLCLASIYESCEGPNGLSKKFRPAAGWPGPAKTVFALNDF